MKRSFLFIVLQLCFGLIVSAQEKCVVDFGKVYPKDFDLSKEKVDTAANAVVIADIGRSSFDGNLKGAFSIIFKRQLRIKIQNKNGLDAASFEIPLYQSEGNKQEELGNFKASTYNLENGSVIETKLENSQVFEEKRSKNWVVKKIAMPAVKEGSIIDIVYTVYSDFLFNLHSWEFQGKYPKLWSEYEVNIPEYFTYITLAQGYTPYHIKEESRQLGSFNIMWQDVIGGYDRQSVTGTVNRTRWVMKNVPALKKEAFTTTLDNHVSKLEFQLSEISYPNSMPKSVMSTWNNVGEELRNSEYFGAQLHINNTWLGDEMKTIVAGSKNSLERMKRIYAFVRDNFTCTFHSGSYLTTNSLRTVFKNRSGNVADLNLLLTAMLSYEGFNAYPVLLSTRSHGYTNKIYPVMDKFNYVVTCVKTSSDQWFLDASNPLLGFGKLDEECYNGHARMLVRKNLLPIYFESDSVREEKFTTVFIEMDETGTLNGHVNFTPGYYESMTLRGVVKKKGKEEFEKRIRSNYDSDWHIDSIGIDLLDSLEAPLDLHYELALNNSADIVYINPLLTGGLKNNPFISTERYYPVEMPYAFDELHVFNMEVPRTYEINELPGSVKVTFNGGQGGFEYQITQDDNLIQMKARVYFKRTNFQPEEYQSLRDFFSHVVKKESEQIVLKKKKSL
ncbi:DUF3857 domain-containing protein [Pinibacter aurantiacus]|uniref:DUF3857 and transglutaminase domain-containing protein n=1 Tax=Pinibacter aurantiacus TaxID=2851599 RepID=A0A9E2S8S2_9BACT|nr:DUF3857 domain-containing protein [Pinibacter aurantiacus]MBV4358431.1 DUF3857 and transglutaminase domain-containing protein [Pinibacter aurantiacus]